MTTHRLNDACRCYVQAMNLQAAESSQVEECIAKYSQANIWHPSFDWMCFRVVNAVKWIFRCSAWQQAKRVIHDRGIQMGIEKGLIVLNPITELEINIQKSIQKRLPQLLWMMADQLLNTALSMQRNNAVMEDEDKNKLSRELSVKSRVEDYSKTIDLLRRNPAIASKKQT